MSVIVASLTVTVIAPYVVFFQRAGTAAAQLFALIDGESDMNPFRESGRKPRHGLVRGELEMDKVTFSYPTRPGVAVLDGISLRLPAGKVTALVGVSGSGKSSIIGLVERWYRPASGSITLDGTPIEHLNLNWLRTQVRLVQQEPVLFNGTVFENIAHGLVGTRWEHASLVERQGRVEWAAAHAYAHDFITNKLPQGYCTQVGERGSLLSGGQKQRIAIARSIISEPRLLLLDEATSALDPHAQELVQSALDNVALNRTTLVISHSLSTVRRADHIMVMGRGAIIERGTHASLMAAGGVYARMVQSQTLSADGEKRYEATEDLPASHEDADKHAGLAGVVGIGEDTASGRLDLSEHSYDFDKAPRANFFAAVWELIRECSELKWYFISIAGGCLMGSAALPGQALLMARITKVLDLPPDEMQSRGNFYSLLFFIMGIATLLVYFTTGWIANSAAQAMNHRFRRSLLDNVLQQRVDFFDRLENMVGALTGRLDSTAQAMIELMSINIVLILLTSLSILVCSLLSIATSWKLGLVCVFGGLVPLVAAGFARIRLELRMDQGNEKRFSDSAAIASEAVLAIRTVSSLAIERVVLQRYTDKLDEAIERSILPLLHAMIWFSLTQAIEYFVLGLGFWWGCTLLGAKDISLYQFFVSFIGVFFAGQNAGTMFTYTSSITRGKSAADYYLWLRLLKRRAQETQRNKSIVPQCHLDSLYLDKLAFTYPLRPNVSVLRDIDLGAKSGEFIALVGPSGCGKSTVVALLERFYDPTGGAIYVDEQKLGDINPDTYRDKVALVPQEATLYPSSIQENVLLGLGPKPGPDNGRVETALRAADAWDFVSSLPEGVRTLCGTNGSHLSGGQRQRIAMARALIRNPRLLLLDEATSALDTASERAVQQSLQDSPLRRGRITMAVAHRLSTIKNADCIYVLDRGRIVEQGSHTELVARNGIYEKLCVAQGLQSKT